jgi:hypothetical protein
MDLTAVFAHRFIPDVVVAVFNRPMPAPKELNVDGQ